MGPLQFRCNNLKNLVYAGAKLVILPRRRMPLHYEQKKTRQSRRFLPKNMIVLCQTQIAPTISGAKAKSEITSRHRLCQLKNEINK